MPYGWYLCTLNPQIAQSLSSGSIVESVDFTAVTAPPVLLRCCSVWSVSYAGVVGITAPAVTVGEVVAQSGPYAAALVALVHSALGKVCGLNHIPYSRDTATYQVVMSRGGTDARILESHRSRPLHSPSSALLGRG